MSPSPSEPPRRFKISDSESQRYAALLEEALRTSKESGHKISRRPRVLLKILLAHLEKRRERHKNKRRLRPSRIAFWLHESHRERRSSHHLSPSFTLAPSRGAKNNLGNLHEVGRDTARLPPPGFRRDRCGFECPAQNHQQEITRNFSKDHASTPANSEPSEPTRDKVGKNRRGTRSLQARLARAESTRLKRAQKRREYRQIKNRWKGLPREDPGVVLILGTLGLATETTGRNPADLDQPPPLPPPAESPPPSSSLSSPFGTSGPSSSSSLAPSSSPSASFSLSSSSSTSSSSSSSPPKSTLSIENDLEDTEPGKEQPTNLDEYARLFSQFRSDDEEIGEQLVEREHCIVYRKEPSGPLGTAASVEMEASCFVGAAASVEIEASDQMHAHNTKKKNRRQRRREKEKQRKFEGEHGTNLPRVPPFPISSNCRLESDSAVSSDCFDNFFIGEEGVEAACQTEPMKDHFGDVSSNYGDYSFVGEASGGVCLSNGAHAGPMFRTEHHSFE